MATKIRPINLHTSVDTHIQGLIDSSFVQARQTAGTDSAATIALINAAGVQVPDNTNIFHNASNSFIRDQGTGALFVQSSRFIIEDLSSNRQIDVKPSAEVSISHDGNTKITTTDSGTNVTGNIAANIRSNPKGFSVTHTVDSSDNALLVGPINVDSGVTLTINGTLMVV
jgi:hypothetical protein